MLKYLSIALPLLVAVLNIVTPAGAEQIVGSGVRKENRPYRVSAGVAARSPGLDALPSVTNLNLTVPVSASEIAPDNDRSAEIERREQANSIDPIWSDSTRRNWSQPAIEKQSHRKLKSRLRSATVPDIKSSGSSLGGEAQPHRSKSISKRKNLIETSINPAPATISKISNKSKSAASPRIATRLPFLVSGNYLRLVRDPNKGDNKRGNPLYTLETYVNGQIHQKFNAVSGTKKSQKLDRNLGDNVAPLPDGLYAVSDQIVAGVSPEIGKTFIGIFPKFETNRDELGIHLDPSFNKGNGYDGTAGCIGITTSADLNEINEFVAKYRPRNLIVSILAS